LETVITGIWIPEVSSPPLSSSLSLFLFLPFASLRAPPSSHLRARPPAAPRAASGPRRCGPLAPLGRGSLAPRRGVPAPLARGSLATGAALGPLGVAPSPLGAAPCARPSRPWCAASAFGSVDPRRGPYACSGAACVASTRPRAPRSPNAFPRAQPHAHGD
jgi:hypothetical protein